jgi:LmbE family N-acetylglucosaminyl deacetylase
MIGRAWRQFCRNRQMASCRAITPDELAAPAVIVAPHQDDEVLGCGGLILLKRRVGATVDIVFVSDGRNSHSHLMPAEELAGIRRQEALEAARILGVPQDRVHFLGLPDGSLTKHSATGISMLTALLQRLCPRQLFVPCRWDFPPDHLATRAIGLASLPALESTAVFEYPVWFWHHWPVTTLPMDPHEARKFVKHTVSVRAGLRLAEFGRVLDISDVLPQKWAALEAHATQMRHYLPGNPHWRSLSYIANGRFLLAFRQPFECFIETHPQLRG